MTSTDGSRLGGPIERVGVVYRDRTSEIDEILGRLEAWAGERSVSVVVEEQADPHGAETIGLDPNGDDLDLIIALGGDGTLLRASRLVVGCDTPILGINLGRLGFLTAFPDADLEACLEKVFAGEAFLDRRSQLEVRIEGEGDVDPGPYYALNDVVIHTSGAARVTPLTLHVQREGEPEEVGSFSADGVIVATPTGSTAYSMSAGGPIIVPSVECMVVTPICPHSLAVRPLVVPATDRILIGTLDEQNHYQVTVDGQVVRTLEARERVVVRQEASPVTLVRLAGQSFFGTLRRKLNWAVRPPERA